jgi:hypothetical protein
MKTKEARIAETIIYNVEAHLGGDRVAEWHPAYERVQQILRDELDGIQKLTKQTQELDEINEILNNLKPPPGWWIDVTLCLPKMVTGTVKLARDYKSSHYSFDTLADLRKLVQEFKLEYIKVQLGKTMADPHDNIQDELNQKEPKQE